MQIYLIGFMGSGKSFTGYRLAQHLNRQFLDLDHCIENKAGQTVRSLFEEKGEVYFRELEQRTLHATAAEPPSVISCGGGTPCFFDNMDWMNEHGLTIYLKTPEAILFDRLKRGRELRPLIRSKNDTELRAYISRTLASRTAYYEQASIIFHKETGQEDAAAELAHQFKNIIGH